MEVLNQSLADKLLDLAETDRTMRMKVINGEAEWDSSVDDASQTSLMEVVDASGWPTISQVGSRASQAAWQLVQHAPDLSFMERCLELMEALPQGEINPANIAYLKDRVLMMNGKPQIYGTQYKGKDLQLYPIEDPEHVEERRAHMGLNTLAEDEAELRVLHKTAG